MSTTPKGRQYRTTEEERDVAQVRGDERLQLQWRIEARQEGEDGPEWVTVGFCLPMRSTGRALELSLGPVVDTRIDDINNEHRYAFSGRWLRPEDEA